MGLFSRKKESVKAPEGFAVGLDPAKPGADRSIKVVAYTKRHRFTIYEAKDGWRWRLVAPNGKITAESGEAYIRRYDCRAAVLRLAEVAAKAKIQEA